MTWRRLVFRTLALLGIIAFFAAFLAIFYPDTIPYFALLFQIYHAILGTPLFVLILVVIFLGLVLSQRK
jgi:hypothetical protein